MNLYRDNWRTRPGTYDDKGLSEDLENYLEDHPNYEPGKDIRWRGNNRNNFIYIRQKYWRDRLIEAGVCAKLSVCYESPINLMSYYDFGQRFTLIGWDSSKVSWGNVVSDMVGIPSGMLGPNPQQISGSVVKGLQALGVANSTYSLFTAQDSTGTGLAIGGYFPGVGVITSSISLGRDLRLGWYEYEYTPIIPR